ncbi:MAG: DoxX family protein [Prevotella sp.]|nr:DoxX family protein [Prevotella sp.]
MVRKIAVNTARMVLAVTFILSGFVKAVDPLGTQYKITDYLAAMHLGRLVPDFVTLGGAVLIAAVEFGLGICLLFAIRRRMTSRLTLLIMLVMTPLTLWLAITNPISDCGCFGDALVLTNWQTFAKNVVLLTCAIAVTRWPLEMMRFISESNQWIVVNYTAVFILAIAGWALYDLPQFDFRPYHVGANIREGMEIPEGEQPPQFETTFIMEKDGEQREFTIDDYPDSTWTFVDSKTVQTSAGYTPPIQDFVIETDRGDDITGDLIDADGYAFLLVSPHLEQADDSQLDLINQLYEYAQEHRYPFYCVTASDERGINRWRDITGAEYPFARMDETTLKTIIRSNPGLVLMKHGTVVRKWSHNRLPNEEQLQQPLEKSELGQMPEDSVPRKILNILLWYVLPLLILTIADRLWAWSRWVKKKKKSNKIYNLLKTKENEKENCSRQLEDESEPAGGRSSR